MIANKRLQSLQVFLPEAHWLSEEEQKQHETQR